MTLEYDKNKVDEMTLALLYLGLSRTPYGARASKGFDLQTMTRLHDKGWIAPPKIKEMSVGVTAEGMQKAEEFFRKHFQGK